jgi:hypothetical protein
MMDLRTYIPLGSSDFQIIELDQDCGREHPNGSDELGGGSRRGSPRTPRDRGRLAAG